MLGLRTSTADRIAAAQAALTAIEQRIAQLEGERAAALVDSDRDVIALDRKIEAERGAARVEQDRIAALEVRRGEEAAAARARAYETGIATIERMLPRRAAAAKAVEETIATLIAVVKKYDAITAEVRHGWPANVPQPGSTGFGSYFSPHFLGTRRLEEHLRNCFSSTTRASPTLQDFVRRASAAAERAGLAEAESANGTSLLEELRARGVPKSAVDNDDEAEAA